MINIEIGMNDGGQRLDRFLRKYLENAPLSMIYKLIRKDVKVNGKRAPETFRLSAGDVVSVYMSEEELGGLRRQPQTVNAKRQFKIAYEDKHIIAVDKPFGLLTHGDGKEKKDHLANQVVDYLIRNGEYNPRTEKSFTPAPANRLDRNTTGLVIFGKTAQAMRELTAAVRERRIEKYYLTIVKGEVDEPLHLLGKMTKDGEKNLVSVNPQGMDGKLMETYACPVRTENGYSLLKVRIVTGRTHQIRVQLADAGYPVIGDPKYGNKKINDKLKRDTGITTQLLHAEELIFGEMKGELRELTGLKIRADKPEFFSQIETRLLGKQ